MGEKTDGERRRLEALTTALRGLFKSIESRPTPDRLISVIDQLDEEQSTRRKKTG